MKKLFVLAFCLVILGLIITSCEKQPTSPEFTQQGTLNSLSKSTCTSIQNGGLVDAMGNPLSTGYDQFGYNYQAHMLMAPTTA